MTNAYSTCVDARHICSRHKLASEKFKDIHSVIRTYFTLHQAPFCEHCQTLFDNLENLHFHRMTIMRK